MFRAPSRIRGPIKSRFLVVETLDEQHFCKQKKLKHIQADRMTQRKSHKLENCVELVGYMNAVKSTLMNALGV